VSDARFIKARDIQTHNIRKSIGLTIIFDIAFIHCVSHIFIRQQYINRRSLLARAKEFSSTGIKELLLARIKNLPFPSFLFRVYAFSLKRGHFFGRISISTDWRI